MWRSFANSLRHAVSRSPRGFHPLLAVHYLTYACKFACPYCCDGNGVPYPKLRSPVLGVAESHELLRRIRRRSDFLVLTGGEPLDHPEVDAILTGLPRIGFDGVVLTTVGAALDQHLDAVAAGVKWLAVSIDTLDHAKGDAWLGRPGTHARILANVEAAASLPRRKFGIVIGSVATPDNLPDVLEVHRWALDRGFRHSVSPQLQGVHGHPGLRDAPAYRAIYDALIEAKRAGQDVEGSIAYLEHMRDLTEFRCRPSTVLATSPTGDVFYPCLELGKVAGNLLETPDLDAIRAAAREKFGDEPRCGNRCQSPCALGFGLVFDRPWTVADEGYRQALGGVRRLFRSSRPAGRRA